MSTTWVMNLNYTRGNKEFLEKLVSQECEKNREISLGHTENTQNIQDIKEGDLVYVCFGGSNETDNKVVRGVYALLEKIHNNSTNATHFNIKQCFGKQENTIEGKEYYSTLLPRNLFNKDFIDRTHRNFGSAGRFSTSSEKNPEFINDFLQNLNEVKLKLRAKLF